jgi:hypothetical protein
MYVLEHLKELDRNWSAVWPCRGSAPLLAWCGVLGFALHGGVFLLSQFYVQAELLSGCILCPGWLADSVLTVSLTGLRSLRVIITNNCEYRTPRDNF